MKEHDQIEVSLTIRKGGGVDLRTHPEVGFCDRTNRVLRALELGGQPPVGADFTAADRFPPREPAPQQDDEALVRHNLATHLRKTTDPGDASWDQVAGETLAHLRARGLMRTPADYINGTQCNQLEAALEVEKAQVRALTAKAEEANAKVDATHKEMGLLLRKCATLEGVRQEDIATRVAAEKRAHDAGQEAVRIGTELLEANKALHWEREALKAAQRRIESLESGGRGSDTQAKAAQEG